MKAEDASKGIRPARAGRSAPRGSGFTLIELMVAVAVVGVLAAIAYPSYTNYLKRGYRSQAEQLMSEIATKEVQYFLDARSYTATIGAGGLSIPNKDIWTCTTNCTSAYYTVAVTLVAGPPPGFYIKATPVGNQVSDGTLYLNADTGGNYSEGLKTRTAGDNKW